MLKDLLTLVSVLNLPSGDKGYIVYCDASRVGLGCVLMQNERVVAYASRQLKKHEQCARLPADFLLIVLATTFTLHRR